jgi:predicted metal-dependent phosphoesterase TrpH
MLIDLHVHTPRYSSCARSAPEEMVARAQEVGLDGLVITEHHVVWPADELAALQARFPAVRLFRGVEITTDTGDDFLIYGPPQENLFWPRMRADELLALPTRRAA